MDNEGEERDSEQEDSESECEDDAMERVQLEVEEGVANFIDEEPIPADVIPASDSDEDEASGVREGIGIRRGNGDLWDGQQFVSGIAFKEAVLYCTLKGGYNVRQCRWDSRRISFKCSAPYGCGWYVYCSIVPSRSVWQIKKYGGEHTCIPNGECEMLRVPQIARMFLSKIRVDPVYWMPMRMQEFIKEKWKIMASKDQVQAARKKVLKWIDKENDELFGRMKDYALEIEDSNPGSNVEVGTVTNDEGEEVFSRFYVCFASLKKSWMMHCRRMIGVDGCYIRTRLKGQILVAVGRDADNRIYPIAWAVVQVENEPNWEWFIKKVQEDLDLGNGYSYILFSDRQKGLRSAIVKVLPQIEHRMCVRHIYGNLKVNHGKKPNMKPLLWTLAWSYSEAEYIHNLDVIKDFDYGVYADVMHSDPRSWCRAFQSVGNFCDDVDNNFTESFNSTLVKAREKAFIPMLELLRRTAMIRIAKRAEKSTKHQGKCTPYVAKTLAILQEDASLCRIDRSSQFLYEAYLHGETYRVNMERRTCTCRKWDLTGIPCEHAYGVIIDKNLEPDDYVADWFYTSTWRATYEEYLIPLRGARYWSRVDGVVQPNQPPAQPGRKKETKRKKYARKKGVHESPTKKVPKHLKRIMHCGRCGGAGHNSRGCARRGGSQVFKERQVDHSCSSRKEDPKLLKQIRRRLEEVEDGFL